MCGAAAAAALQHVNLLLVLFAGACLATGARLRWDPSLYVAVREAMPAEYRVLAAAVPGAGAALLALAHLALAATAPAAPAAPTTPATPAPKPRRTLLYTYAGLTALAVVLELGVLGWVAARVEAFSRSAQAQEMQQLLATREHLAPLLQHLARWHPLPDRIRNIMQEAEDDLPWNGYVAAAALAALLLLQLAGALLALLAPRPPRPHPPPPPPRPLAPQGSLSQPRLARQFVQEQLQQPRQQPPSRPRTRAAQGQVQERTHRAGVRTPRSRSDGQSRSATRLLDY